MGSIASVVTIELRPQKAATVLRIANSKVSAIGQRRMNYFQPVFSHRSGSRGLSGGAVTLDRAEGPSAVRRGGGASGISRFAPAHKKGRRGFPRRPLA